MTKTEWIQREAPKRLRFKLDAEATFRPEIKRYFNDAMKRLKRGDENMPSLAPVIERQYQRIANRITGKRLFRKQIDDDRMRDIIEAYILKTVPTSAAFADQTTDRDIDRALEAAREELGPGVANSVLYAVAARIFLQLSRARIMAIAIKETQTPTEAIRMEITKTALSEMPDAVAAMDAVAARELADVSGDYLTGQIADGVEAGRDQFMLQTMVLLAKKVWNNVGDEKVRDTHIIAGGQTVPIGEPFTVGGFQLMVPGDTSLGAPMKEVAGCRCWSTVV